MNDQINLIAELNTSQILVGLDLGTKTIGVSVSDIDKIIATPITTIKRKGIKNRWKSITTRLNPTKTISEANQPIQRTQNGKI